MNDITFIVLKIIVSVAAALMTVFVIPLLKEKLQDVRYQRLLAYVEVAVRAAEQTIKGSGQGHVKKDEVINYVTAWMLSHGIKISEDQLDQLIEAAVYVMNNTKEGEK